MIYSKIFRAARANLLRVVKNFWRKTHEIFDGGDLTKNHDFY